MNCSRTPRKERVTKKKKGSLWTEDNSLLDLDYHYDGRQSPSVEETLEKSRPSRPMVSVPSGGRRVVGFEVYEGFTSLREVIVGEVVKEGSSH